MAFSGIKNFFGSKSSSNKKNQAAFEDFEVPDDFKFLKIINMQHLGIPANSTSTLAFDKTQGFLALGTMDGCLKIFGKESIEIMLIGQESAPIEILEFISNKGLLISYSGLTKSLTLWSLETLSSTIIPVNFQITRIVYDHGSYAYIGTQQGSLRVFNIVEKRLTCFELKPNTLGINSSPLIDISQNPVFSSKLALAFENGDIIIWDLPANKTLHKLISDCRIHVCTWSPDGESLAVGRRDGSILVFKIGKNAKVCKNFRPDLNASDLNVSAIKGIFWTESGMAILGGMPFDSNQQISVVCGKEMNDLRIVKVPGKFNPMLMALTPVVEKSESFLVMSEDEILTFNLPECQMEYIVELYGGNEVLCSKYYSICDGIQTLEESIRLLFKSGKSLNYKEIQPSETFSLLITGHCEGIIRFWGVSSNKVFNILNLCLQNENSTTFKANTIFYDVSDSSPCKISCLLLENNKLLAGFDMGKIGIWTLDNNIPLINIYKYHKVPVLSILVTDQFIVTGDMGGFLTFFNSETSDVEFYENDSKNNQTLSITYISVIHKIIYICYSNGAIKIYNPFSGNFLPTPKLEKIDLKSQVPKRSEWGILKILHTPLQSGSAVICYEKSMSHLTLSDFSVYAVQSWSCPMISCNLGHIRSEVYIYILHSDFTISLLEFNSLKRVWKSSIPSSLHSNFKEFHLALDGHFIITTSHKSLIAGWITMHDDDASINEPIWKPSPEVKKTDIKSKSFLGIRYSKEINYNSLCILYLVDKPASKFQAQELEEKNENSSEEEEKEEEEKKIRTVESQVASAHGAVAEALNKVSERGDKIKSLEDKMREMTEKSKNFAQMAAEIAKKQKNKKWWQI